MKPMWTGSHLDRRDGQSGLRFPKIGFVLKKIYAGFAPVSLAYGPQPEMGSFYKPTLRDTGRTPAQPPR
jgi:hypothetical protein